MVPFGERVANFLQAHMTTIGTVVEAKNVGGLLEEGQTYRVVVTWDPEQKCLDVSLIGTKQDPQTVQNMLETLRKIILGLNPKLKRNFGVTLQDHDLSMDYLYAKSGKVLLRYKDGNFITGPFSSATQVSQPTPIETKTH